MDRRIAGLAILISVMPCGNAWAQTTNDAIKAMIGTWEISTADREKTCAATFKADAVKNGYKLELDASCADTFPMIRDARAWTLSSDTVKLVDSHGRSLFEFTEVENGMFENARPGEGLYFLQNQAAVGPPFRLPEQMFGDWGIVRGGGKPICEVTLSNTVSGQEGFILQVKPGCAAFVTRFNPSYWRMDRGELVMSSVGGENWRFEEEGATTWHRVPERAEPVMLVRK